MHKLVIGVATYGSQYPDWWSRLVKTVALLAKIDVEFTGVLTANSMLTDSNRNLITKSFLEKTNADWLFWYDADNRIDEGGIKRLLDINKTMVSALYYSKRHPYTPIAYYRMKDGPQRGLYASIEKGQPYERGEIIPVDAAGMGSLLTHRSVYEDIMKSYVPCKDMKGAIYSINRNDIQGKLPTSPPEKTKFDNEVYKGQLRTTLYLHDMADTNDPFPFFLLGGRRTEDMHFFETAHRVGHKCWLDTSVEVGHIADFEFTGEDYRRVNAGDRYITEIPAQPLAERVEILNAMP